jgi:NADPH-dependent 2,4-dienoyl-CoA reductase/sulfur reductase-like enzyme
MDRRDFLSSVGAVAGASLLPACTPPAQPPTPPGRLLGNAHELGHRLRTGNIPAPSEIRRVPVLIVGGGIGGLSAGWKLNKAGFHDFLNAGGGCA